MSQSHLEVMNKTKAIVLARNRTLVIQILGTVLRRDVRDFENMRFVILGVALR
jgi:hypothetical protein